MSDNMTPFEGFSSPNYTQVPDELFDQLMPTLTECELRVLLYIVRRTFGFKRDSDAISLSQMIDGIVTREGERLDHGAGVARSSAVRAIKGLVNKGVITATKRVSPERGNETTTYALRFKDESSEKQPVVVVARFHGETGGSSTMKPAPVSWRNPQETGEQETDIESSNGKNLGDMRRWDIQPDHTASNASSSDRLVEEGSMAAILQHRVRRDAGVEDRAAIGAAVERFAETLGDRAAIKVSISRALNLYQASRVSRGQFIDVLHRAAGEVRDRQVYPGQAGAPRNRMAYFFAVVEDRLGLKHDDGAKR